MSAGLWKTKRMVSRAQRARSGGGPSQRYSRVALVPLAILGMSINGCGRDPGSIDDVGETASLDEAATSDATTSSVDDTSAGTDSDTSGDSTSGAETAGTTEDDGTQDSNADVVGATSGGAAETTSATNSGEDGATAAADGINNKDDEVLTQAAGSTADAPIAEKPPLDAGSGVYLVGSEADTGAGACENVSVDDVVQGIHEDNPELADITRFAPDPFLVSVGLDIELPRPDENYYQAVITGEGKIMVSLRRCDGDVVDLACTDESWWYFETDEDCSPQSAGEYRQVLQGDCFETEGTPSTLFDPPLLERDECGFDAQSRDLRGSYDLTVFASGQLCPGGDGFATPTLLETPLTLEIDQDPSLLRDATVTLYSAQFPCLDGSSFPADVVGDQVIAEYRYFADDDSVECYPSHQLTLSFSFGAALIPPFAGILDYWQITNDPCTSSLPEYAPVSGFHFMFESL